MISIQGRRVVINENVLLARDEDQVVFEAEHGLKMQVRFINDGTGKASLSTSFSEGRYQINLSSFGSALGTAVSGSMVARTTIGHPRPGEWRLRYSLSVHTVGEAFKNLKLTVSEERSA